MQLTDSIEALKSSWENLLQSFILSQPLVRRYLLTKGWLILVASIFIPLEPIQQVLETIE
jgi:predicted DNA-binding transcriptional regulator